MKAKAYIESKYRKLDTQERERNEGKIIPAKLIFIAWEMLAKKMNLLNLNEAEQALIKQDILHKEAEINRKMRKKITVKDFDLLSIIGRGAFGEVRICRFKETGEVVAMKKMRKTDMLEKKQVAHVKGERDMLVKAKSPWVVDLKFSF